ncbi:unnamed protein product [Rhizoctonia solani]|uniref:Caspase domain-containing protein n=1 Tax=Rhizoctonia solani TaxID=456999 RepID=A0A8H3A9U4_9AGAM|nr:unnamed protein product [Rhizoctonia solani]
MDEPASISKEYMISGRLKRIKTKANSRFLPYPGLTNLNTRRRHRGLTPTTVEINHIGRKSSLETALFGDPRLLQPDQIVWFVLVVAVDYLGLQDPEHDLESWRTMVDDPALNSEIIYFFKLAGEEATPENIKKELAHLYHDSEALGNIGRPNLFVYLTGEGDDQNRMCLLGGKSVSEDDISRWLAELRTTYGYTRPIALVLDICRNNKDKPGVKVHYGIELICSASPGEQAEAIRFESDQAKPYSCFMLAFIAASTGSRASTSVGFKADLEHRLNQLIRLINSAPSKKIPDGSTGEDGPSSQAPDWSRANVSDPNSIEAIFDLVAERSASNRTYQPSMNLQE